MWHYMFWSNICLLSHNIYMRTLWATGGVGGWKKKSFVVIVMLVFLLFVQTYGKIVIYDLISIMDCDHWSASAQFFGSFAAVAVVTTCDHHRWFFFMVWGKIFKTFFVFLLWEFKSAAQKEYMVFLFFCCWNFFLFLRGKWSIIILHLKKGIRIIMTSHEQ